MSKKPGENKFHKGNRQDGKHYWLTPPYLKKRLNDLFDFDFDPCPYPKPDDFDGLTCKWGKSNYVNPPFGSILHKGPNDKKPKKKGPTAWARKCIEEKAKGNKSVMVFPVDKWVLMMIEHCSEIKNLGDVKWIATEDGSEGKGLGRHIAMFVLDPLAKSRQQLQAENTKLQAKLDLAVDKIKVVKNWMEASLDLENGFVECRGDGDCDHCMGLGIILELKEALAKIKEDK